MDFLDLHRIHLAITLRAILNHKLLYQVHTVNFLLIPYNDRLEDKCHHENENVK